MDTNAKSKWDQEGPSSRPDIEDLSAPEPHE